jgi:hypothetical protein
MLHLDAVDPENTIVHEDGHSIEINPVDTERFTVVIASVIPIGVTPDWDIFVKNFRKESWDPNPLFFLQRAERKTFSLHETKPQDVAYVSYTFDEDTYTIDAGIDTAVASRYTYETYMRKSARFDRVRKKLEQVIFENIDVANKYKRRSGTESWNNEVNESSKLIFGLSEVFNINMSKAARKAGIPTLRYEPSGAKYDVSHNRARFSGPLRRAASFINMLNFASHLSGRPYFSKDHLEEIGCFSTEPV